MAGGAGVPLWGAGEREIGEGGFAPVLEPYTIPSGRPRGAVVVCPGGGYTHRAPHEGEPIARAFNAAGFQAFVVQYRIAPDRHPAPMRDLSRAVRLVRSRADTFGVAPDRIAVCGFSAGGHLAASLGVCFGEPYLAGRGEVDRVSNRPDALILCYPVISAGPFGHAGSFTSLLGPDASDAAKEALSLELRVSGTTPPAFLWHTADDAGVPVENSLLFAQALRRAGVPFELHVYPSGPHGLGLAAARPHIATWTGLCAGWLTEMGWPADG